MENGDIGSTDRQDTVKQIISRIDRHELDSVNSIGDDEARCTIERLARSSEVTTTVRTGTRAMYGDDRV